MREQGLPKVLAWRWAPCAALAGGALSFVGFALLVIPDHIGAQTSSDGPAVGLSLANAFGRSQATSPAANADFSGDTTSSVAAAIPANPTSRVISRSSDAFPRRGFTPPLERPEAPAQAVPPPPPQAAPPQPPAPPPQPEAPPPPQPEQPAAQPAPPPPEAAAAAQPQQPVGAEAPN